MAILMMTFQMMREYNDWIFQADPYTWKPIEPSQTSINYIQVVTLSISSWFQNKFVIIFHSDFRHWGEAVEEEEVCKEQKFSAEITKRRLDEESGC